MPLRPLTPDDLKVWANRHFPLRPGKSIAVEAPRSKYVAESSSEREASPEDEIRAQASDSDEHEDEVENSVDESDSNHDEAPSSPASGKKAAADHDSIWDPPFSPQAKPQYNSRAARRRSSSIQNPPSSAVRRHFRHSSPILDDMKEEDEVDEPAPEPQKKTAVAKTNGTAQSTQAKTTLPAPRKGRSDQPADVRKFNIESILEHRPSADDPNLFELYIRWELPEDADEENETWEPEDVIHRDAPRVLFAYWRRVPGGRESQMEDSDLWYISHVKNHRVSAGGKKVDLQVSWVGSPQATWEPEASVVDSAPAAVIEYWESKGGRDKVISSANTKKRGATRGGRGGRGASRKRART